MWFIYEDYSNDEWWIIPKTMKEIATMEETGESSDFMESKNRYSIKLKGDNLTIVQG